MRSYSGGPPAALAPSIGTSSTLVGIGQVPFSAYLGAYLVPTLIGNVLGGVSLVSTVNHAQAVSSMPRPD